MLAVLAVAGDRGVSREKLLALFWPESDEERARASLRQTLYALRQDLGSNAVRSVGAMLALDGRVLGADVTEFHAALASGDRERAASLARGSFLDGFFLQGAPEFERWVEEERARLTAATLSALVSLATDASRAKHHDAAVEWWRQLVQRDPLSGRFVLGYLKALAARGDRVAALSFARQHEAMVRRELQADPDPEVLQLAAELRTSSPPNAPPVSRASEDAASREDASAPARVRHDLSSSDDASALPPVRRDVSSDGDEKSSLRSRRARRTAIVAVILGCVVLATGWLARARGWLTGRTRTPTMAVGLVREDGVAGMLRMSRVLTDMIATDLARVEGLTVLSNSRLIELMRPGQDSAAGYAEAARRAGASELLEGQLVTLRRDTLDLEMRRVELRTGIVKDVYRVRAVDRYALVDSLVQSIAQRFRLQSPSGPIAEAITRSPIAYRLYDEGLRAYFQNDLKAAQRFMNAALAEDSSFAMAAYWVVKIGRVVWDPVLRGDVSGLRPIALRLAARAPDRERLMITADLLTENEEPLAVALAESLTTRFQNDPRAYGVLGRVYWMSGDWPKAVVAIERAIALDSAAERDGAPHCMLCEDFSQLADVYFWSDSLPAVVRVAHRYRALRPSTGTPLFLLGLVAQRLGDSATAYQNFARLASQGGIGSWLSGVRRSRARSVRSRRTSAGGAARIVFPRRVRPGRVVVRSRPAKPGTDTRG